MSDANKTNISQQQTQPIEKSSAESGGVLTNLGDAVRNNPVVASIFATVFSTLVASQTARNETASILSMANPFASTEAMAALPENLTTKTLAQLNDYVNTHPFADPKDQQRWLDSRRLLDLQAQWTPLKYVIFNRSTKNPQDPGFDVRKNTSQFSVNDTHDSFEQITGEKTLTRENMTKVVNALYNTSNAQASSAKDAIGFIAARSETQDKVLKRLWEMDDMTFKTVSDLLGAVSQSPNGTWQEMLIKALSSIIGIANYHNTSQKFQEITAQNLWNDIVTLGLILGEKEVYDYLVFAYKSTNQQFSSPLVYNIPSQNLVNVTLADVRKYTHDEMTYQITATSVKTAMDSMIANGGLTQKTMDRLVYNMSDVSMVETSKAELANSKAELANSQTELANSKAELTNSKADSEKAQADEIPVNKYIVLLKTLWMSAANYKNHPENDAYFQNIKLQLPELYTIVMQIQTPRLKKKALDGIERGVFSHLPYDKQMELRKIVPDQLASR